MLRIGVFSDPHGNLPALKAALAYLEGAGCREFLCCGDLVGVGPWPQEVAALLQSRGDIHGLGGVARCGVLTLDRSRWRWQAAAPAYDLEEVRAAFAHRRVPEGPALLRAFYGPAHPSP